MHNSELCPTHAVWFGDSPLTCPQCDAIDEQARKDVNAAYSDYIAADGRATFEHWIQRERSTLYAIKDPSPDQWARLHTIDIYLGY